MDIENLPEMLDYLRHSGRIERDELPQCCVLAGGVSNRTVLVNRTSGDAWILKQALTKLRVEEEWFSSPDRILREAEGMAALRGIAPPGAITRLLFTDPKNHLLAMESVPSPHKNWKSLLLSGHVDLAHFEQFANLLSLIHTRGADRRFRQAFEDRSYFESLRIEPYYLFTAANVRAARPFLETLVDETRNTRLTLVHGDYSPKNILIHRGQLVLLDHEVIHFGDPGFDVGFAMAHFLSKAHHVKVARLTLAMATERFWAAYSNNCALASEESAVRHSLGCLLARVDGRSPLEYLTEQECTRQRDAVLALVAEQPGTMPELISRFLACL